MLKRMLSLRPVRFAVDMAQVFLDRRGSRSAAELAFFLVLSIFPMLIMVNAIVGMLDLNVNDVLSALEDLIPDQAAAVVADYVTYISTNQSRALFWGGLIMTVTSSSAAFRALIAISADIYRRPAYPGLWSVLASVVFSIGFLVIMYASMVVVLTGNWFFTTLRKFLRITAIPGEWPWMRFWLLFVVAFLFLAIFYRATAPREKPRPPVLIGSLLTAALLVAASILFSWFIGQSSRYSLVYGSLGSVIILMVWLYLCGNILIVGAVFNYVWYCHKRERTKRES